MLKAMRLLDMITCFFKMVVFLCLSGEYFPKAFHDKITVCEDESIAFDVLSNDYFAGNNATMHH